MEEVVIYGKAVAIYFENNRNFYKVIRIEVDQDRTDVMVEDELVITGQFVSIHLDTTYQFFGQWTHHPKYGQQFSVTHYQNIQPTSRKGMIDYLSSHRFKGIGVKTATAIMDTLGDQALDIILEDPQALDRVPGLTRKKAQNLRQQLMRHQGAERIFMQLSQWGFSPNLADKIFHVFKEETLDKIKDDPFCLIEAVEGIGFSKADQIAAQLGGDPDDPRRICAALVSVVGQIASERGDTYVTKSDALQEARNLLEKSRPHLISDGLLFQGLDMALMEDLLLIVGEDLVLPSIFYAEYGSSKKIKEFIELEEIERYQDEDLELAIDQLQADIDIIYDEDQRRALKLAMSSPMSIITGGPGTGKTTLVRGLIHLHARLKGYDLASLRIDNFDSPIRLAAPTGRAAKRMQEASQLPATTIHRLIGFTRDSEIGYFQPETIEGSLLIVDEMSMVDVWLMNWLLEAIPYDMQVVFVGDKDQLPSVGPGKVFADMIESQVLSTISLHRIYRQAKDSSIIRLAHDVRQGRLPEDLLTKQADRSFIPCPTHQIPQAIHQIVNKAIEKGYTSQTLQVLAPMYKGPAGIDQINQLMQAMLNPPKARKRELTYFDRVYRVGDKVLQLVNNTEEGVYNGDVGQITAILTSKETESKSEEVVVSFDEVEIHYQRSDLNQLTLAYCTSIHKAQGSEYDLVILPLVNQFSRMLRRDILYTAITRASQSLILLGDPQAFYQAATHQQIDRKTNLLDFLGLVFEQKVSTDQEAPGSRSERSAVDLSSEQENLHVSQDPPLPSLDLDNFLSLTNYRQIDPMIGMEGLTPFDFMPN